ncbi:helix-turn-helix domain-containing protein [Streptomyces sp. SID5643]|uniref:helix-turn-helix domain-containing protein n=1 Tax=Streptomyces sp. SID5643 TaxID=2690307 RepID=UPI00136FC82D|nr:helix-turn-helix domain-containing protein [Streptomyces sp. SID5643]MZF87638.1 DNA-binding response regulator [Streptomyces sp. SID5643]
MDSIEFVDDEDLTAPGGTLDLPVLIPVTSDFQAEGLRAVRVRHPLSMLIGVTNDVLGQRTYYAIRSGANFVLNLAIPGESQIDMLCAQIRAHRLTAAADATAVWPPDDPGGAPDGRGFTGSALREQPGADDSESRQRREFAPSALPDYDKELVGLLCTSMTVTEIARRYYCSERSMYRRIRKLYNRLGVGCRTELVSEAAALGLTRPLTACAS